jgi:hypothetical protein
MTNPTPQPTRREEREIKEILKPVIDWYFERKEEENKGEIDSSYIYDVLPERFGELRRGDLLKLIELIISI